MLVCKNFCTRLLNKSISQFLFVKWFYFHLFHIFFHTQLVFVFCLYLLQSYCCFVFLFLRKILIIFSWFIFRHFYIWIYIYIYIYIKYLKNGLRLSIILSFSNFYKSLENNLKIHYNICKIIFSDTLFKIDR